MHKFRCQYTENQFINAQRLGFRSNPRIWIIFGFGFVTAIVLFFVEYTIDIPRERPVEPWVVPTVILLIFVGVFLLSYLYATKLNIMMNKGVRGPINIVITENHIYFTHDEIKDLIWQKRGWEAINRVFQNKDVFLIIFSNFHDFLIIPKELLHQDEEAYERVRGLT